VCVFFPFTGEISPKREKIIIIQKSNFKKLKKGIFWRGFQSREERGGKKEEK
jgi:hypothetical protein